MNLIGANDVSMKARRAPTHMAMAEMSEDRGEDALRVTVVEVAKQIGIDLKEKQLEALQQFTTRSADSTHI